MSGGDPRAPRAAAGDPPTRAGFVALAGRPNVGKSTLLNRIVGTKVAIVSSKPQTTRRAIRGVATGEDWQIVLVDLPGSQRPRDALTERMQHRTERELRDSDAALLVLNGEQSIGPGDRFIARAVRASELPCVVAVNKVDALDRARTMGALATAAELDLPPDAEIFPISARTGAGVEPLLAALVERLPESPFLYPPSEATDLPTEVRLAELVREQVLARTRQEVPHSVEVEVDEIDETPAGALVVVARVWVEAESQKGILVGRGGRMIRSIGTASRQEIEALTSRRVHVDLTVRVRRSWRADEAMLDRLGIE
jgi:GTPase